MSNAFSLSFTLQQHTPLIHFQHEQSGATLRATELKPKLDRFLAQKITGQENPSLADIMAHPEYGQCLIGGTKAQSLAFDYKVKIYDLDSQPSEGKTALITKTDIGHWKKSNVGIKVEFSVFYPILKELISLHYHAFFACTNFGKRQSKGWGSFYPTDKEEQFEQWLINSGRAVYRMDNQLQAATVGDEFYTKVLGIWRVLKSGINLPNDNPAKKVYKKSLAFKYMAHRGFRWDKRLLKQDINGLIQKGSLTHQLKSEQEPLDSQRDGNGCDNNTESYNDWVNNPEFTGEYRFVRALLGMPELYEFQAERGYIHQVSFSKDSVERFKAPVTFKVFKQTLYAIAEPMPPEIFGQIITATVKSKPKNETGNQAVIGPFDMPSNYIIPTATEFNLTTFLDRYFRCVGLNRINQQP